METEEHGPAFEQQLKGESEYCRLGKMLRRMLHLKIARMQLRWREGERFLGGRGDRGQGRRRNESTLQSHHTHMVLACTQPVHIYIFYFLDSHYYCQESGSIVKMQKPRFIRLSGLVEATR